KVGTGMTTANSFGSPWKSLAIVITVRSPSRTSTTCEALLNSFASAFEPQKPSSGCADAATIAASAAVNTNRFISLLLVERPGVARAGQEEIDQRHRE